MPSETINFEDAITGQFCYNGNNAQCDSFTNTIKSPSCLSFNKKVRPLFTSTPRQSINKNKQYSTYKTPKPNAQTLDNTVKKEKSKKKFYYF